MMTGGGKITSHFKQNKRVALTPSAPAKTRSASRLVVDPAGVALPGVCGEHAVTDFDIPEEERLLRQFDLATKYGPCVGLTRLDRWQRANRFGLEPPQAVLEVLQKYGPDHPMNKCLWNGRV